MDSSRLTKLLAVIGISTLLCVPQALAGNKTRTYNNPIFRGLPIDATPTEWDGTDEEQANEDAANLFCEWKGYDFAISWSVEKDANLAERGTYRFSEQGGDPEFCDFCRWHFSSVRCFRFG